MKDYIIPVPGDIWQDANDKHNLVISGTRGYHKFTVICLETGVIWREESIVDWNDPNQCSKGDGKPFYRNLIA